MPEQIVRMASSDSTTSENPHTSSFDPLAWFETPPLPLSHASLQIESIRFSMAANSLTNTLKGFNESSLSIKGQIRSCTAYFLWSAVEMNQNWKKQQYDLECQP
ncbi:hypothetical protein VNO80_07252 [Phaseolus coccineus]|uniref:Uncharacterized protein n=1 Tax=Phaseolus coccineus TaxID=3886 RepID=A0AAN9RJQ8_PHACN